MKSIFSKRSIVLLVVLLSAVCLVTEAQQCRPSRKIRGRKVNKMYTTYTCSPQLSGGSTKAYLTLNSFEKNGDGGGPSECDNHYHNDNTPVVALSTGWTGFPSSNSAARTTTLRSSVTSILGKGE
ncbi:ripening-related protein 1 [Pyrus ussuriensis x Pyrus communis]|uniref:Ripening-related protein 1 n=1 Tax=Pyrus ussuriensis x Pyrus communis TaxID=2448454 RepID=A0A5N5FB84_9ROSA|nr:ripening-related protein 1 [Pyrus ussuriensis x Pyrus communis]